MSDRPYIATWELLVRYHRTTTSAMDEHLRATFGYSLDDYDVLHQISGHGAPVRMGELAELLLVADSSCHRIVGRLVDADLIKRSQGKVDRREVFVELTPAGRRLWRRMATVHTRDIERFFSAPLTESEVGALGTSLQRLVSETGE